MKFNRQIGDYAGEKYTIDGTHVDENALTEAEYRQYLAEVFPGTQDQKILEPIFKTGNWMSAGAGTA